MDRLLERLRIAAGGCENFYNNSCGLLESTDSRSETADELDATEQLYLKWSGSAAPLSTICQNIPIFHHQLPSSDDQLSGKLHQQARACLLQRRSDLLLNKQNLKDLYLILDEHQTGPCLDSDKSMLGWADFCAAGKRVDPSTRRYFTATVFAKLQQRDRYGRISLMGFFNYVLRKEWLHRTRIGLSLYDTIGDGFLTDIDIEAYIRDMIPTLSQLSGLDDSLHIFYVQTAVRKFLFFLDPQRNKRISVENILSSGFLDELLEMREKEITKEELDRNWFSVSSTLRIYGQYLDLDQNHNGMLSKNELARYGTGTLSNAFLDQLFQSYPTFDGEIDYKWYLDFVLAMEHSEQAQSLQYMFRILDIGKLGYLNAFTLNFFLKDMKRMLELHQGPSLSLIERDFDIDTDDITNILFDMVNPVFSDRITVKDLIKCGQGAKVVSILSDLNGFLSHTSID